MSSQIISLFQEVQPLLTAIGDVSRQNIVKELMKANGGPLSVNAIASKVKLSQPTISHHLKILRTASIVSTSHSGTQRLYYLAAKDHPDIFKPLKQLIACIEDGCSKKEPEALPGTDTREAAIS